ncbi:MAG: cell division protein FtsZ [Bacteroidales bacterium]|nr:cell division protein FtsZ [Bacteroidales bacterium]
MIQFDAPKDQSSIIKVLGIGGGGSNAVTHMFNQGIKGVDFIVCNTDAQALEHNPVATKIQIGEKLTEGLGAGSKPEIGREAAIENIDKIKEFLGNNAKMVFITAGMGGGTGTGAAPIIAATAKEMGILTVGIVTLPFLFEGKKRRIQAEEGIKELKEHVDTLLVICNDKLREIYGNLILKDAFAHADDVLSTAAKGIAEIITGAGLVNVDFNDVNTVMNNGGTAIMGYATAEGENRALEVAEKALACPILNDNNIKGASQILLYINSGTSKEVTMDEVGEISEFVQNEAGSTANIIFGVGYNEELGDKLSLIVIATGFKSRDFGLSTSQKSEKIIIQLGKSKEEEFKNKITEPPVIKKLEIEEPPRLQVDVAVAETEMQITDEVKDISENDIVNTVNEKIPEEEFFKLKIKEPVDDSASDKKSDDVARFAERQMQSSKDRIARLKELSYNLKTQTGNISDLEKEPAYERKKIEFVPLAHSSESQVSKFSLSVDDEKKGEIKSNNSFLHDNVD